MNIINSYVLLVVITCSIVNCSACAKYKSSSIDVFRYSTSSVPSGSPITTLHINGAKKGFGRVLYGANVFEDGWHIAFVTEEDYREVLNSIDEQLRGVGFKKTLDFNSKDVPPSDNTYEGDFIEISKVYSFNTIWTVYVRYWDYRKLDKSAIKAYIGSDLQGYTVEISKESDS
jgi:hypothetical protein